MRFAPRAGAPHWWLFPALGLWGLFMVGPGLWGVLISMTNVALTGPEARAPRFVGLENYLRLLQDPLFYNAVRNSFLFVLGSAILGQCGLGLLLAVLTSERRRIWPWIRPGGRLATTLCYLSWITPETVVGLSWISFLSYEGVLNQLVGVFGMPPRYWLVQHAMLAIIAANIWWGTGWSMMLFKAALESIPREVEEAAEVDGASGWSRFRHITLPLLRGPLLANLTLITIWTYGVFGLPLMLTGGGPVHRTELMTIYAYLIGFRFFKLGYGMAVSVGILIITLGLALVYYRTLSRER